MNTSTVKCKREFGRTLTYCIRLQEESENTAHAKHASRPSIAKRLVFGRKDVDEQCTVGCLDGIDREIDEEDGEYSQ